MRSLQRYPIWQDATSVETYENIDTITTQRASLATSNTAGQTYTYVARSKSISGRVRVWRDGVLLGGWTDATPLTSGAFLSLRTDISSVSFAAIEIHHTKKYYYAGDCHSATYPCVGPFQDTAQGSIVKCSAEPALVGGYVLKAAGAYWHHAAVHPDRSPFDRLWAPPR